MTRTRNASAVAAMVAAVCLADVAVQTAGGAQAGAVTFVNIAARAGIDVTHLNGASAQKHIVETMGSGGLLFDADGDGWLDVLLVDGGSMADPAVASHARHRLFRNRGDGTFLDDSARAGLRHEGFGMGACAADYDGDGRVDVYITAYGPGALYRNAGDGRFEDISVRAGVGAARMAASCAFADVDGDGDLDLFVTGYVQPDGNAKVCGDRRARAYCRPDVYHAAPDVLYRNNGDGTFADGTSALAAQADGKGLGAVFGDYDDDGRMDLFVANDLTPNALFHNEGNGVLRDVGLLSGVAVAVDGRVRAGMGTDFGDADGDGRLDLVVTNFEFETHSLFRNLGAGLFADATLPSGLGPATLRFLGFGVVFADVDNDGDLDLAIGNGHVLDNTAMFQASSRYAQRNLLLVNDGRGRFTERGSSAGPGFALEKVSRTVVAGDIDNDGDLDLLVTNNGQPPDLLRNEGGSQRNALAVRLRGGGLNRDAIGARIVAVVGARRLLREVKAGSSYLGQNDTRVHFGLGDARTVDRVEVRWPSGRLERLDAVAAGQIVTVGEGEGIVARQPFVTRQGVVRDGAQR